MRENEGQHQGRDNRSIKKRKNVKYLWQIECSVFNYQLEGRGEGAEKVKGGKTGVKITSELPIWTNGSLFRDRKNKMRSIFLLELMCFKGQIVQYRTYCHAVSSGRKHLLE